MSRIRGWKGCKDQLHRPIAPLSLLVAVLAAGLQVLVASVVTPALAGYELPPGERITNLPHIPRAMPQKEAYEVYDPVIGRNFDIKNFWLRADLRVRPEYRNGVCFGGGAPVGGACNTAPSGGTQAARANAGPGASDFYVQQWTRLGIGYDLSPDVNFYFELIDSAVWGGNGNANNAGNNGDPLNHACGVSGTTQGGGTTASTMANCRLGVRAAYVLVRNLGDIQGLSMKAGRQYVIFGNHSLFGHFDWANTGYSHDGIMFSYSTKTFDSYLGWFRNSETDLPQGAPVGSLNANIGGCATAGGNPTSGTSNACSAAQRAGVQDGGGDVDMFIFYNQIKSIPGFLIEPYIVYYMNNLPTQSNASSLGAAKHANQVRTMLGGRIEMRKGNWDIITENAWQTGAMASGLGCNGSNGGTCNGQQRDVSINAWASRNWLGYTAYNLKWKPRLAFGFDYASGDGDANCATGTSGTNGVPTTVTGMKCKTANTFENFFPTNHIHMGYADIMAWKNMWSPQANFQFRPTERDHFEFWYSSFNLASARDNWYRAAQGPYVWSKTNNTKTHVADEYDFSWTRMFADGKVALQATYSLINAGDYIAENLGVNSDQHWGFVQLWMNF